MSAPAPLKEEELRAVGSCALCRQPVLDAGPTFFCLRIEHVVLDLAAVRRRMGLGMMLGSDRLAQVMSPGEPLAHVATSTTLSVCLQCLPDASLGRLIDCGV